jgi:glycosyltransferase involved in cell wall biosynthesis
MQPRDVLIVYPLNRPYYAIEEAFGIIPSHHATFVVSSNAFEAEARSPIRFLHARYLRRWPLISRYDIANTTIPGLSRIIDEVRPQVVVSYEIFSGLSKDICLLKKKRDFRHLVVAYETTSLRSGVWGLFPATIGNARVVRDSVDACVSYSDAITRALVESGVPRSKIVKVRPGIFVEDFVRPSSLPVASRSGVLYLGVLRANKGLRTLTRAMDAVNSPRYSPTTLRLAGGGPLLRNVVSWKKRRTWMRLEGHLSRSAKVRFLWSGELLTYPSEDVRFAGRLRWEEQIGFSVIESMAASLPVVVTNSGSLPEIVGRTDVVVPQRDPNALATKISELLRDEEYRRELGSYFSKRAREIFDIHRSARAFEAVLSRLD